MQAFGKPTRGPTHGKEDSDIVVPDSSSRLAYLEEIEFSHKVTVNGYTSIDPQLCL